MILHRYKLLLYSLRFVKPKQMNIVLYCKIVKQLLAVKATADTATLKSQHD